MPRKLFQTIFCLCYLSMADLCLGEDQTACKEWLDSIKDYDNKVESVIQGEPEHLISTLNEVIDAKASGNIEKAHILQKIVHEKVSALKKISAPQELTDVHKHVILYYIAVETAIDAELSNSEGDRSVQRRGYLEALLQLYEQMASVLIQKECQNGDLKELKEKRIPQLKEFLKKEFPE